MGHSWLVHMLSGIYSVYPDKQLDHIILEALALIREYKQSTCTPHHPPSY